jgi:hypothetical protein
VGAGRGEGGLVIEGELLSFESSAAKAGREQRHNNPMATGTALESIEASELIFVPPSKDHGDNSLAIFFIIIVTSLRGCWENPMVIPCFCLDPLCANPSKMGC